LLRQLFRGRIHTALPSIVVEDNDDLVALWVAQDTEIMRPVGSLLDEWQLELRCVTTGGELRLCRPEQAYAILLFFRKDGAHRGWYVNLEQPLRRTSLGFDYEDLVLDIWVAPNGHWQWLDEDELEEVLAAGLMSETEAREVRAVGEDVIARLDTLLPTGWEDWRPDPGWKLPSLPARWDHLDT
jgi:protein associated with RNAse G/E